MAIIGTYRHVPFKVNTDLYSEIGRWARMLAHRDIEASNKRVAQLINEALARPRQELAPAIERSRSAVDSSEGIDGLGVGPFNR